MYSFNTCKNKHRVQGFTLIELLVVIAIIGLLATVSVIALNNARMNARDARRKADLRQIRTALDLYYDEHGMYPPAGTCAYGTNCYIYSTSAAWFTVLAPYLKDQPVDPINNLGAPWYDGHYTYSYGNVMANGQGFDLVAQLENHDDPDRCEIKQYKFVGSAAYGNSWCGSYSDYMYALQ